MPILRRCLGHNGQRCAKLGPNARCDEHTAMVEAARLGRKRAARPYTAAERVRRAEAVAAWVRQEGQVCPGWRTPRHAITDWTGPLTADHPHAVSQGGAEGQSLTVMCAWCNSRKGNRSLQCVSVDTPRGQYPS